MLIDTQTHTNAHLLALSAAHFVFCPYSISSLSVYPYVCLCHFVPSFTPPSALLLAINPAPGSPVCSENVCLFLCVRVCVCLRFYILQP